MTGMKKKLASLLLMLTLIMCQMPALVFANDMPADVPPAGQQEQTSGQDDQNDKSDQNGQPADNQENIANAGGNEEGTDGQNGDEVSKEQTTGSDASGTDETNGGDNNDLSDGASKGNTHATVPANAGASGGKNTARMLTKSAPTAIENVTVNVAVPSVGATNVDASKCISIPDGVNYSIRSAGWALEQGDGVEGTKAGPLENKQYYINISLEAKSGYAFSQGDNAPTITVQGAEKYGNFNIINSTDGGGSVYSEGFFAVAFTPSSTTNDTANLHVYTPGHGTVKVDGVDKGTSFTGSWPEGTEVSAEAVPATGYKFSRWRIKHSSGNPSLISTASTTLTAGTDLEAEAGFGLEKAPVTVTPPTAGSKGESTPPSVSVPAGAGYSVEETRWVGENSTLDALYLITPDTFEAGETYYMYVKMHDGSDSFSSGGAGGFFETQLKVTGGNKEAQKTWSQQDGIVLVAIISVTIPETTQHTVSFDTDSHYATPSAQTVADGGKASRPAVPVYYAKASDYDTTGLRFHNWYTKPANQISSYWEFCYTPSTDSRGCIFDFNNKTITEDTTAYAVYEGVLTIKTYDVTNSQPDVGGKFDHRNYDSYSGSTDCSSGYQSTDFYNMPAFLKAKPAEGYVFVGWSTSTSKDNIISKDAEYEYTFMGRATLYALFEKDNVTIKFNTHGATTDTPEDQVIPKGGKAAAPANPTKIPFIFAGWYDNANHTGSPVNFSTATFDKDTTLHAAWKKTLLIHVFDKTELSTTKGGKVKLDSGEWETSISEQLYEGDSVKATAKPDEGYRFVGWSETGATGEIVSTDESYTINSFDGTKDQLWAVFEVKPPVLTLHWSSVDGKDLMDPIKIEAPKGTNIDAALKSKYGDDWTLDKSVFTKDGYMDSKFRTNKPITDYTSEADLSGDSVSGETAINADKDIYYIMYKEIDKVSAGIESPVCGTETSNKSDSAPYDQTNAPAVSVNAGNGYKLFTADSRPYAFWTENGTEMGPFAGNFKGDSTYYAKFKLLADFGYVFSALPTANLDNAEVTLVQVEDAVRPTNLMVGGAVKAVHDWGEWKVVKEPTETENGLAERRCKVIDCGAYEEEIIPKLTVEYSFTSGDGSTWMRGTADKLNFVVKRSRADETAIDHFKGLKVDGKEVPSSGYAAKAGSVVIDLMPAYLGTLADGDHTLTAVFDDGNKETSASFKVLSAADKGSKDKTNSNKKGSPATGDEAQMLIWLMILCTAGLALSDRIIRRLKNDSADR